MATTREINLVWSWSVPVSVDMGDGTTYAGYIVTSTKDPYGDYSYGVGPYQYWLSEEVYVTTTADRISGGHK